MLANIWSQLLRIERVGVHDKFFELGGDSILSLQVTARANQAGLRLTANQIFEHQTIAELASVAETASHIAAEQGLVTGEVPLTPIQRWFFEQDFVELHHWNQARLLELRQNLDPALLEEAIQHLISHHDALRLQFRREGAGWTQFNAGIETRSSLTRVDLAGLSDREQDAAFQKVAAELQAEFNLAEGPLLRAAWFGLNAKRPDRLLIVIHHLAIDGVSWRILLEDLESICQQLGRGETIRLPAKTTSFRQWAQRLTEYARGAAAQQEADYWLALAPKLDVQLPVDFTGGTTPRRRPAPCQ